MRRQTLEAAVSTTNYSASAGQHGVWVFTNFFYLSANKLLPLLLTHVQPVLPLLPYRRVDFIGVVCRKAKNNNLNIYDLHVFANAPVRMYEFMCVLAYICIYVNWCICKWPLQQQQQRRWWCDEKSLYTRQLFLQANTQAHMHTTLIWRCMSAQTNSTFVEKFT